MLEAVRAAGRLPEDDEVLLCECNHQQETFEINGETKTGKRLEFGII
jgi:hypothetical protein